MITTSTLMMTTSTSTELQSEVGGSASYEMTLMPQPEYNSSNLALQLLIERNISQMLL